jgi:hypothetical protein
VDLVSAVVELDDLVESVKLLVALGGGPSGGISWGTEDCCCRSRSHTSLFFAVVNAVAYGDVSVLVARL